MDLLKEKVEKEWNLRKKQPYETREETESKT
jgi:hypothetical protein